MVNRTGYPQVHAIRQPLRVLFNIDNLKKARMKKQESSLRATALIKIAISCLSQGPEPILISRNY